MKILQFLLAALICILSACTPLQRGFDGAALISPSRPEVMLSAPGLPTLAEGQIAPFLYTDRGYQFPSTLLGVYGKDKASPMAITALSFVPNDLWEWDSADFSGPHGTKTAGAVFGGKSFAGTVRIVNGANDPFSPLVAAEGGAARVDQLAGPALCAAGTTSTVPRSFWSTANRCRSRWRRGICCRTTKRCRPLPPELPRRFRSGSVLGRTRCPDRAAPAYLDSINGKYLGVFLGSMTQKDIWPERI